jgi:Ca2+-binding RTX toxin-like protein
MRAASYDVLSGGSGADVFVTTSFVDPGNEQFVRLILDWSSEDHFRFDRAVTLGYAETTAPDLAAAATAARNLAAAMPAMSLAGRRARSRSRSGADVWVL